MPRRVLAPLGVLVTLACAGEPRARPTADTARGAPQPSADASSPLAVTLRGIGRLEAGMSMVEAAAAVQGALDVPAGADSEGCSYATWRGGPAGVRVMVEGGRVARVDVESPTVRTAAGAGLGDTEEQIAQRYPNRVRVSPHKYEAGHYLTVIDPADTTFALVFETTAGKVTRYRAGRRPAVEYVEGCS